MKTMDSQKILRSILRIKDRYGSRLHISGHYYMQPDVLAVADSIGDSYQLAKKASEGQADYLVFCAVSFMAETGRLLCRAEQRVFIPDPEAGCPLADTIGAGSFSRAMKRIEQKLGQAPAPVLYVNSTARLKALAGQAGGSCCTSANAAAIIGSIIKEGRRVFFLPDRNLGRNTGRSLGLRAAEMSLLSEHGGEQRLGPEVKLILWDGCCPVHERFSLQDVQAAREKYPGCRILVHPECTPQVVEAADFSGSTSQLLRDFEEAERDSILVVGTEINFIRRLRQLRPQAAVHPLRESRCADMSSITPQKLLDTLMSLEKDSPVQEVFVAQEIAEPAREALRRMIRLIEKGR
jgi:quinolinate synthase